MSLPGFDQKTNKNHYFHQADCALMNLTQICQNRRLDSTHDVHVCENKIASLTKILQICHFHHCLHFWT